MPPVAPSPPRSAPIELEPEGEPEPEPESEPEAEIGRFAEIGNLIVEMLADSEFGSGLIGVCLLDESGEQVAGAHAERALIPASAFKTLTSATALEVLGPEFRFETALCASGGIDGAGTLEGDLVIRGGGDPTLTEADLRKWVEQLQAIGLKQIGGGVVGDATLFPEAIAGEFWNWGDVGNGYGSPVAGLNLNRNRYHARFAPGATDGDPAKFLGSFPDVPGARFANRVRTGPPDSGDRVMIYAGPYATRILLEGTVPAGVAEFRVTGAVPDPAMYCAHHLDRLLREAGIRPGAPPSTASFEVPRAEKVALLAHRSSSLIEIVTHLHKVSDNHETECLFRLLGARSPRSSADVIREHWGARGLDFRDCRIVDGSGLSRANFIAPRDLARLQWLARRGDHGGLYYGSLREQRFEEPVRWKGGAMSAVRAYAGFVTSKTGEEFAFAMMFNHYRDASVVGRWRDRIVKSIVEIGP